MNEAVPARDLLFYSELAHLWPLISPVEHYAEEAAEFTRIFRDSGASIASLLELGCGGGHNAWHLKQSFQLTLCDASPQMLDMSRALNPQCAHVLGDMRTLNLGAQFDAVFVHDAIDYITSQADLARVFKTAFAHCRAGGVALFVPDWVREHFSPGTDHGGSDGPDGWGVRYLEWTHEPDPASDTVAVTYTFLIRDPAGGIACRSETHTLGLFPRAVWRGLLEAQGFEVEVVLERTAEDRAPRELFLARRPIGSD